ncbi:YceI family protein [Xanthomonas cucurbitae]|uniref:YceI family protein n=1 Tax=Xanthomonas cucurbitae TaxID=56453 RepID=A0A2S7DXK6_9XANT|nr:YceI family protein [Xanthomonas cucurbitae]PPU78505.1 hypothetical protein XcuCFBP2542_02135 [Xanthomonas cucurbitae]WDM67647.1 YceI family protein [Xanthomonas cucurbitae]WDM71523.1 YceI family protein [Xanthomonas cucurbitae]WDM79076.1 YceI family protein [Xanthomonas cucurbitae]WDM82760.1 YceI family protein [Xanthomonas cucurbitae]
MSLSLRWVAWLALWAALPCLAQQQVHVIDPAQSRFGFEIRTRFGMRIEGLFPRFHGEVVELADGREQVRFRLDATQVEIPGKDRYTGWMRGEDFFDVARYPVVEFESLPYTRGVVTQGGDILGNLTIRGITHMETLHVASAECARPGYDCEVISRGTVLRGRYGMNAWQMALGDRVTFILRGRLQEARRP